MQDIQLYVQGNEDVIGTISFAYSDEISSNVMDFTQNPWVVGKTIVNNATGVRATILSVVSSTNIQLSITGFSSGGLEFTIIQDLTRVDLFKDETISLTQSIKNIKDISKIQTSFTQAFNIPASKINNKVFKHFYNSKIQGSFNASILKRGRIKLNGVNFQEGKIRFLGVKMKDNKPSSYKITFIGNTVSLKEVFKEDEISELEYLDVFNHIPSFSNISTYMQQGYNFPDSGNSNQAQPDMMYPFISAKSRYYYNSDNTASLPEIENIRNIYSNDYVINNAHADYKFLSMYDFKPAIKVYYVLKAIEKKYGFTFSNDFIKQDSDLFDVMYMWCNRESGSLYDKLGVDSNQFKLSDITLSSGNELRYNLQSFYYYEVPISGGYEAYYNTYEGVITPTSSGSGYYDVTVRDEITNVLYDKLTNATGVSYFSMSLGNSLYGTNPRPVVKVESKQGISSFAVSDITIKLRKRNSVTWENVVLDTSTYTGPSLTLQSDFSFREDVMPKMKVLDFLKGMFNMFNLIAYFEGTELVVKTLNDYYLDSPHQEYNLDKYVDSSTYQVNRSKVYSEINYEFEKAKTLLAIKSNESTGDEFGNERFKSEGDTGFDGRKYDVKVKFSKMLYENLIDESDDSPSNIFWGYCVDKDEKPVLQSPTLFINQRTGGGQLQDVYLTDKPIGITSNGNSITPLDYLMTPMNVYFNYSVSPNPIEAFSINFGSEFFPYQNQVVENSLFRIHHQSFIENMYIPQARILKITAHLPLKILLKYRLNDRFIIRGQKYLINSVKTNLQTGKSELELLTDNYQEIE